MPENETLSLDPRMGSRWIPMQQRIAKGESFEVFFRDFQEQFRLALKCVFKQWEVRGVNRKKMFEAALSDPSHFINLVKQTGHEEYARLLKDVSSNRVSSSSHKLTRSFLNAVFDRIRDIIQIDRYEDFEKNIFLNRADRWLDSLTSSLIEKSFRVPRRSSRDASLGLEDLLNKSLLG